jgi:dTDP-4-amino-4,6-dideoxygalactose transaminase
MARRVALTQKLAVDGGTPVRSEFLPFGVPSIGEEEIAEVVDTLRSGWIGQGKKVARFEQAFAQEAEAPIAIAVSSCTAALHVSLVAVGVRPGDEVLVPALTFAASATAVEHAGATPVLCDVEPGTLLIDLADAGARVTERTRAIIPVHFGGLPCPMDALLEFGRKHRISIIEDAAHAVGARDEGRPIGSFDTLGCFSFYANKNLTTAEGGMITLRDEELADRLRMLRLHGLSTDAWKRFATKSFVPSELETLGFKYNLTDLQASLGIHQLAKLEQFQIRREELARRYDDALCELPGVGFQTRSPEGRDVRHALHLYLLVLDLDELTVDRDTVVDAFRGENIGVAIHYRALHLEPHYMRRFGLAEEALPISADISRRVLTLPLSPSMNDDDAGDVLAAASRIFTTYAR